MRVVVCWAVLTGLMQDRPEASFSSILATTVSQRNYSFKITGGADSISGVYENGAYYLVAGTVRVAGHGGSTVANVGGGWVPLGAVLTPSSKNAPLKRLAQTMPPHCILSDITGLLAGVKGNPTSGFASELKLGNLSALAKAAWIGNADLERATNYRGSVKFFSNEGRISRTELTLSGSAPRGFRGPGRPITVTVTIQLSGFGSSRIPDDVRHRIGLKS